MLALCALPPQHAGMIVPNPVPPSLNLNELKTFASFHFRRKILMQLKARYDFNLFFVSTCPILVCFVCSTNSYFKQLMQECSTENFAEKR
jgi:hypothetical protein